MNDARAEIKPWEKRVAEWRAENSVGVVPEKKMMRAEIAELRAALADRAQRAGAELAHKTAETRMDTGFDGGAVAGDRAQQGEPVDDTSDFLEALEGAAKEADDEWIAGFVRQHFGIYRAATKAAAPADASSQQKEMSVRVAPAPAGQHDADFSALIGNILNLPCRLKDSDFTMATDRLNYKTGHRDARHDACDLVAEFASQSRAQRTTIDNENCRAAPVPDTGIPTAGEDERAMFKREKAALLRAKAYPNDFDIWLMARRAPVSGAPTSGAVEEAEKDWRIGVPKGFLMVGPGEIRGDFASFGKKVNRAAERLGTAILNEVEAAPSLPSEAQAGEDA